MAETDYRPRLVATNQGNFAAYVNTPGSDKSVLEGRGHRWTRVSRTTIRPSTTCRDKVAKATGKTMVEFPEAGAPSYRTSADTACRYVALFVELAEGRRQEPDDRELRQGRAEGGIGHRAGIRVRSRTTRRPTRSRSRCTWPGTTRRSSSS